MKHLKYLFVGLFVFLFLFSMNLAAQYIGNGSITGTVWSEADSLPIAKAKIFAFKYENMMMHKKHSATTDSLGIYKITTLPQGQYRVLVEADSFVAEFYKDTRNPLSATAVTVNDGVTVTGIDFYLKSGGIISGKVTDSTGVGIPNALVAATPYNSYPRPVWIDSLLFCDADHTDENGYYSMTTLDSGKYRVAAKIQSRQFPFFQIKYYDNTHNYADATPVNVKNGKETPNINFKFDFGVPSGGIAGTITDAAGKPLAGIWVFAWKKSETDFFHTNFKGARNLEKTDKTGKYEIKHLRPGDYLVSATRIERWGDYQTIWYDGVSSIENATPVSVADTITTGIDFVFDKTADLGAISGKIVYDTDGSPVANAFVQAVWAGSFAGRGSMKFRPSLFTWTNARGEYKIADVQEGKYIVLVHKYGYTEFYDNTQDIEKATVVEVKPGAETKDINFSIPAVPDMGSQVAGVVTDDSTGAPILGAVVTLFPVIEFPCGGSTFRGKFTLFDYYATISDSNGNYMIAGIPKGKYIAACWAPKYIVRFYNNKRTPWDADRIELDGTEKKTGISFALTPGCGRKYKDPGATLAFGTISGQVTDNEGRYVANAYVTILDDNHQALASEITGPDGCYTLVGIPADNYYVKVDRMPYNSTYYGDVTDLSQATSVGVGETGNFSVTSVNVVLTPAQVTSVPENNSTVAEIPMQYELYQNYPNPFNPTTTIRYALPTAAHVTLTIYNLQGEVVKTLVNGFQAAKYHQVTWNGENEAGEKVAAGVYLYQLKANHYKQTMRLIYLR